MEARFNRNSIACIRSLIIDETNTAKSGHPGMALDVAPTLYVLFRNHLTADPTRPDFFNRDRFILSSGHCSALLYAMLHVSGYDVTLDDLKHFRQLDSKTPGHPEVHVTPGVDATSGPLGQGLAQAVGFALAEKHLRHFYPEGNKLCSHYTYCLAGDGCLEEGISQEAIAFAGLHKLNRLILFLDQNTSTLDGPTSLSSKEDMVKRFESVGWHVITVKDGNDVEAIDNAITNAKKQKDKPTVIILHSVIGYGTELEGNCKSHGSPLGEKMGDEAKKFYGYPETPFFVREDVYEDFMEFKARGKKAYEDYQKTLESYKEKYPDIYENFKESLEFDTKKAVDALLSLKASPSPVSGRESSEKALTAIVQALPWTIGGSADVKSSVKTPSKGMIDLSPLTPEGRNINFGIREFLMASIQNGALLHGGFLTYVGSFLVFSDYMRNAIRMSALEDLPAIYVFTHDSLAVGEDGPTHQPIEQTSSLRLIPNTLVFRPGDENEVFKSYALALENKHRPSCMILSRQNLAPYSDNKSIKEMAHGFYEVYKADAPLDLEILCSGSEVSLVLEALKLLHGKVKARVISCLSFELFDENSDEFKEKFFTLPRCKRVGIEMDNATPYYKYACHVYDVERFGKSGKTSDVLKDYGFTPELVADYLLKLVKE